LFLFLLLPLLLLVLTAPVGHSGGTLRFVVVGFFLVLLILLVVVVLVLLAVLVFILVLDAGSDVIVIVVIGDALGGRCIPGRFQLRFVDACTAHIDFLDRILSMRITG